MAREIELITSVGRRITLLMSAGGREIVLVDGETVSSLWRPVWPGDHEFTLEEDGKKIRYAINGYSVDGVVEWRVLRDGHQILRVK